MSRLIDADALIKDIDYSADMGGALGKVVEVVKYYAKFMAQSAPTIEERNTGHWIDFSMSIKGVPTEACGECGEWSYGMGKNYCPNCGAKMKGENND